MKRKVYLVSIICFIILAISTVSLGFSVNMELDKTENLKVNDEVILTLNLSEEIVGATFKISYDSTNLELVESKTTNLSVSENDGKVACVYFDMSKTGTDNLKIKFKIVNSTTTTMSFNIEDGKFVSKGNETSYSQNEIAIQGTTIKSNNTISDDNSTTSNSENNTISNTTTNESVNNVTNNTTNITSDNTTNNDISNNSFNLSNTTSKDNTISTSTIPYTGHSVLFYIAIIVSITAVIYTGIRIKMNKFEDKYDK